MALFIFKKVTVPSGETKDLTAYESWTVRWDSVKHFYDRSYHSTQQAEVFTNEDDAKKFRDSLKAALVLLKDGERKVEITKN